MNTKAYYFYVRLMERYFGSFSVICFGKIPDCRLPAANLWAKFYTFEGITKVHIYTSDPLNDLDMSYLQDGAKLDIVSTDCYGNLDISFEL